MIPAQSHPAKTIKKICFATAYHNKLTKLRRYASRVISFSLKFRATIKSIKDGLALVLLGLYMLV